MNKKLGLKVDSKFLEVNEDESLSFADKNLVNKTYVDDQDAKKQDTLVSATNIKTINSESLLGSGDMTIHGLTLEEVRQDNETHQYDSLQTVDKSIIGAINSVNTSKQDTLVSQTNIKSINGSSLLGSGDLDLNSATLDEVRSDNETHQYDSLQTVDKSIIGAINSLNETKQDTLVSQTNIKSINGTSLLGSGDLDLSTATLEAMRQDNKTYQYEGLQTKEKSIIGAINETVSDVNLKQDKTDNELRTSDKRVVWAINFNYDNKLDKTPPGLITTSSNVVAAINEIKRSDDLKQTITDNNLQTGDKTVVGAINELKTSDDSKQTKLVAGANITIDDATNTIAATVATNDVLWTKGTAGTSPIVVLKDQNQTLSVPEAQLTHLVSDSIDVSGVGTFKIARASEAPVDPTDLANKTYVDSKTTLDEVRNDNETHQYDSLISTRNKTIIGTINELITILDNSEIWKPLVTRDVSMDPNNPGYAIGLVFNTIAVISPPLTNYPHKIRIWVQATDSNKVRNKVSQMFEFACSDPTIDDSHYAAYFIFDNDKNIGIIDAYWKLFNKTGSLKEWGWQFTLTTHSDNKPNDFILSFVQVPYLSLENPVYGVITTTSGQTPVLFSSRNEITINTSDDEPLTLTSSRNDLEITEVANA